MIASVLVVCEGNICRSPMGAELLRQRLPSAHVGSAGIGALVGHPADPHAQDVMRSNGFDISTHRAAQLGAANCREAELILVMQASQKRHLEERYPSARGRIFQLGHFSKFEVPDPYRKGRTHFERCFELVDKGVADWVERIESARI
ncbi:protein tyrosine phosphatase [Caballeronia fortuita]|uniref:protein-tyrosine-phosphatase n=1 Tax=Caballeronia fortuita TaxID=1777138 RepID=A0A157Z102_9BURK|nr:low molecular weight protein-tyrosine-phosphatase [Caballeronia fortuita]SAK39270.1 protein tyrosine phosphatase [Caballeronia fortuita]